MASTNVETLARMRLRSIRTTLGYSLDEIADRSNLSASTVSRIETGKRALSIDVLVPLAEALQVSVDDLLRAADDDDVVIRPTQHTNGARTTWALNRVDGRTMAMKMRLEPEREIPATRVHPGFDWFLVLEGRVLLQFGERHIEVAQGEAAEFSTMTPHAISAINDPAELVMVFDREGQRAHLHR